MISNIFNMQLTTRTYFNNELIHLAYLLWLTNAYHGDTAIYCKYEFIQLTRAIY